MREELMKMLEDREDEMIEIRRYLHEHPELSFKEEKTAQYIVDFYKGKDVEIETNVGNGYGIIVTIKGDEQGKTVGLRADCDALPMHEEAEVPFKSKNESVKHACGKELHVDHCIIVETRLMQ